MSTTKHTPGPWEAEVRTPIGITYVWQGGTENAIAKVYAGVIEDAEANARLIAAAPELLDALQSLLARVSSDIIANQCWHEEQRAARAAIAKATGNTSADL